MQLFDTITISPFSPMRCSTISLPNTRASSFCRRRDVFGLHLVHPRPPPRKLRVPIVERAPRHQLRAGAEIVAQKSSTPANTQSSEVEEITRYLLTLGWEQEWIDGVTERIAKRQLKTTVETVKAACEYILSLGIDQGQLCNMASLCYLILGIDVKSHLEKIVQHLKSKGVKDLVTLLTMNPRLLTYSLSSDGKELEKGKLRAAIKVEKIKDKEYVSIVTYREGTKFKTAPITPYAP